MKFQKTLKRPLLIKGIGLHSGEETSLTLKPLPPNSGCIIKKVGEFKGGVIRANLAYVTNDKLAITLTNGETEVSTIEHVLGVLCGLGIDNVELELAGSEFPAGDGSGKVYVEEILKVGIETQSEVISYYRLSEPIWVDEGKRYIVALPAERLEISYGIDFPHQLLRNQYFSCSITPENFVSEIASARTFCFLEDVERIKSEGLGKGGSLDNAIVIGKDGYLNPELRFEDECVRHKILDLLGALYLLGRPLRAHIIAWKAGHWLDLFLVRKIREHLLATAERTQ
jgi:UDP-3-O-acyl N-acetylglucosamine deacetylase